MVQPLIIFCPNLEKSNLKVQKSATICPPISMKIELRFNLPLILAQTQKFSIRTVLLNYWFVSLAKAIIVCPKCCSRHSQVFTNIATHFPIPLVQRFLHIFQKSRSKEFLKMSTDLIFKFCYYVKFLTQFNFHMYVYLKIRPDSNFKGM